jgi:hypothetical protein
MCGDWVWWRSILMLLCVDVEDISRLESLQGQEFVADGVGGKPVYLALVGRPSRRLLGREFR